MSHNIIAYVQDGKRIVNTLTCFTQNLFIGHMSQSVCILFSRSLESFLVTTQFKMTSTLPNNFLKTKTDVYDNAAREFFSLGAQLDKHCCQFYESGGFP
jgi:hypothetical protein